MFTKGNPVATHNLCKQTLAKINLAVAVAQPIVKLP